MSNTKRKLNKQNNDSKESSFHIGLLKTQHKLRAGEFIKDVWKARSIASIDKHLSEDFVDHNSWLGVTKDLKSWKLGFQHFRKSFPKYKFSLDKLVSEGDIVAIKYNITIRVKQNSLSGNDLDDNQVTLSGVDMYRIAKGKIVERWGLDINNSITQTQRIYN